jgi:hypothetical protein
VRCNRSTKSQSDSADTAKRMKTTIRNGVASGDADGTRSPPLGSVLATRDTQPAAGMSTRAMSLRLPEAMADEIAGVARTDDEPISEAVRAAIDKHIAERRTDPDF